MQDDLFQVDAQPQVTLVHDDNGNLTEDGTQLYTFDPENRLTRVNRKSDGQLVQAYEYDALGRRVHTINSNGVSETVTTHVYAAGPACLVEYDSTSSEGAAKQRWFVHGQSFPDPLLMVDSTGMGNLPDTQREYLYFMKDMLGSVTGLVDDNGEVVERYIYDPYGKTEIATVTFYHDHDLDGDIDASDVAHYDWCTSSGFPERAQDPMCVFVHNRDGDYELTSADGTLFAAYVASPSYNSNGAPPPEEWERLRTAYLDANNDQVINLYDWYGFQVCEGVTTSTGGMNDHLCLYLYDLDGDGDVDLNEGQQGCNLFTGQWSTAGDGHPGQATGSRFGNPFMWTGQRYDAPVGLYHFLFRSYSPNLGQWLQRDPLGYVEGANLREYVSSQPTWWIDPFGLTSKCMRLRQEILNSADKLWGEVRSYKPENDQGGKPLSKKKDPTGQKRTKPQGHRQKLQDKQQHLKNKVDKYHEQCPDDPPLPEKVKRTIEYPVPSLVPAPAPKPITVTPTGPLPQPGPTPRPAPQWVIDRRKSSAVCNGGLGHWW